MTTNVLRSLRANLPRVWSEMATQKVPSALLVQSRFFVSRTLPQLEKRIIQVPTMGDSITEGTIVEWTASVGQAVKDGDVVALVETDKVTVDIKAEIDGIITEQFGAVDDTVEVGANLYEIDTEAEATAEATAAASPSTDDSTPPAEPTPPAEKAPAAAAALSEKPAESHGRIPSIQFLGKEGWARRRSGQEVVSAQPQAPTSPNGAIILDGSNITSMYGRPTFTDAEMEALILGGASLAPKVISPSNGATFE